MDTTIIKQYTMKQLFTIVALLLMAVACTTEEYYRNANRAPELTASVDLDRIDTIKTGAVSSLRTFTMSVTATDENRNMNLLQVITPTGSVRIDGEATNSQAIETVKERGEFTRSIEFTPNNDGLHTITAQIVDDFGTSRSVEKRVFSFTNMRPIVGISHSAERINANPIEVEHTFDFTTSYDRDERWGGAIDSIFVIMKFMPYIEETGDDVGGTYRYFRHINYPGPFDSPGAIWAGMWDDGTDYITDAWVWVKDNEGAVSDTVHFNIGHVE